MNHPEEPVRDTLPEAVERDCANHPGRRTLVSCATCGKPLCPDCMVYSSVGIKCKECARLPKSARVTLGGGRLARAIGAGLGAGTAVGAFYYFILGTIGFFYMFFLVAAGIGYVIGEAVLWASGHCRGRTTAIIAVACTVWAFIIPPLVTGVVASGLSWSAVVFSISGRGIFNWVMMLVAGYLAWQRNR